MRRILLIALAATVLSAGTLVYAQNRISEGPHNGGSPLFARVRQASL